MSISYITEVVLYLRYTSDEVLSRMEEDFTERGGRKGGYPERLAKIATGEAGGAKVFVGDLYAGAYNYLPQDDLLGWLEGALKGSYAEGALVVSPEQDVPTIYVIRDGALVESEGSCGSGGG